MTRAKTQVEVTPTARSKKAPNKNKERAFHSAKDYETSASQLGDVIPPDTTERRKASIAVADYYLRNEIPTDDLTEVLMALGIHPDQPDWDDGPSTNPVPASALKGI